MKTDPGGSSGRQSMRLYYYEKSPSHNRAATDRLILEGLRRYCQDMAWQVPAITTVSRTAQGKPYLAGVDRALHVGVTHTDALVVIAFAQTAFGIDCEHTARTLRFRDAIAGKYFSDAERRYTDDGADEAEKDRRFLEIWVKKEAYVKYLGTGLAGLSAADTFALDGHAGHFEKISHGDHILFIYWPF